MRPLKEKEKSKAVMIRLPESTVELVDKNSEKVGLSRSAYIRQILSKFLL